jgi:hypothetical protein
MISVVRVEEDGNRGRSRHQFAEQLEPLWYQFIIEQAHTREVTAWTVEARDETKLDRVAPSNKDDRKFRCSDLCCKRRINTTDCGDDTDRTANEIGGECRQPIVVTLCPTVLDGDIQAIDIPNLFQP